jgi:hypothetical protein
MLFDTTSHMVPSRIWIGGSLGAQIEGIPQAEPSDVPALRWGDGALTARGDELVIAAYELTTPFPKGTTAAAIFVFEVPQ